MCKIPECITSGDIRRVDVSGCIEIRIGCINGYPFSAIITDTRTGEHLHFPADDYLRLPVARPVKMRRWRNGR